MKGSKIQGEILLCVSGWNGQHSARKFRGLLGVRIVSALQEAYKDRLWVEYRLIQAEGFTMN